MVLHRSATTAPASAISGTGSDQPSLLLLCCTDRPRKHRSRRRLSSSLPSPPRKARARRKFVAAAIPAPLRRDQQLTCSRVLFCVCVHTAALGHLLRWSSVRLVLPLRCCGLRSSSLGVASGLPSAPLFGAPLAADSGPRAKSVRRRTTALCSTPSSSRRCSRKCRAK